MAICLQNFYVIQQLTVSPHNQRYIGFLKRDSIHQPYLIQLIQISSIQNIHEINMEKENLVRFQHCFLLEKVWVFIETLNGTKNLVLISRAYSEWCTFRQLVDSYKKLSRKEVLEVMLKLVDLLEYLHSQGMYLGSISLHQLYLLGREPLLDYLYLPQLSKKSLLIESNNSSIEDIWIAPQTLQEDRVDQRSDIWCLGALFSYMLQGKPPFNEFQQLKMAPKFPQNNRADIRQWNIRFLLEMMLQNQPLDRPSLPKVKQILKGLLINPSYYPRKELDKQEPSINFLKNIKVGSFIVKYEILKILKSEKGKISCLTFDIQAEEERMLKMMEVPKDWVQITLKELQNYSEIKHENLVEIRSITSFQVIDNSDIRMVALTSKYYPEGTLEDELQGMAWMSLKETKNICLQVISALSSLHMQGIIHQNLTSGNIYRQKQKLIFGQKLTIFELSKRAQGYANPSKVPIESPPECIQNESPEQSSDVWCLAALFISIHLNQMIKQSSQLSYDIKSSNRFIEYLMERKIDQSSKEWLKEATNKNPQKRIGLAQISEKLSKIDQEMRRQEPQISQRKEKLNEKEEMQNRRIYQQR